MSTELVSRISKDQPLKYKPNYQKAYIIAITPRSGSTFLCDLLTSTGKAGKPMEFFNRDFMTLPKYRDEASLEDYFSRVVNETKTDNDVFGIKISYGQALPFIEKGLLKQLLPNAKIINLFRRNIIRQAVSLHIAAKINYFHTSGADDRNEKRDEKLANLDFNANELFSRVKSIDSEEKGWFRYLDSQAISYMKLFYEDNVIDIDQTVKSVITYIGLETDGLEKATLYESTSKKLSTIVNDQFYDLYLSDKKLMNRTRNLGIEEERWLEC